MQTDAVWSVTVNCVIDWVIDVQVTGSAAACSVCVYVYVCVCVHECLTVHRLSGHVIDAVVCVCVCVSEWDAAADWVVQSNFQFQIFEVEGQDNTRLLWWHTKIWI